MADFEISKNIVMKPLSEVKPYIRNPRRNDKTVDLLVQIIPKVGFNVPLVIDHNGIIVKGHSRFRAAIKLGMTEVPCVVTDADEESIKLDRLADNKISEFSEWVNDDLLHELDMLNVDFDLSSLGFEVPDFQEELEFGEDEGFDMETESPQDAKERYEAYLKMQEEQRVAGGAPAPSEPAKMPQMTTDAQIQRAMEEQRQVAAPAPKYYKVVCEHCGHVMFVDANNVWEA